MALYKMWLGVLEWSIGVRDSIVEAWVGSWNLKRKKYTNILLFINTMTDRLTE